MIRQSSTKQRKAYEIGRDHMLATRSLTNLRNDVLNDHGLSSAEWLVLGMASDMSKQGGIRVTDLATLFGVKTTYITATLNSLKEKGYVEAKSDKGDSRVRLIVATKQGSKAVAAVEKQMQVKTRKFMQNLVTDEQLSTYNFVLQQIAENVK